jgi:hypothetical protein
MKVVAGQPRPERNPFAWTLWCVLCALCIPCTTLPSSAEVLSAISLQYLMTGREGTTVVFHGGADKVYYAPHLHNTLRRSAELGPGFIKQQLRPDTISEGSFIGTFDIDGRVETVTGIASISADKGTGRGVVLFLQSFADDTTKKDFEKHDRLYSVLEISEAEDGFTCRRSKWRKLLASKSDLEFTPGPCEFSVGNSAVPATRE